MALILKESDVKKILKMADGIRLVEESFKQYAEGRTDLAPRLAMKLSGEAGNFRIMAAIVPDMGGFGLKTLTGTPGKRKPESTYFAMLYFDVATGALLSVIPATHITGIRTGAASGVATKYLAREDASVLGLFGAGFQGRNQVAAVREVRSIREVKIYDVVKEAAARLAEELVADGVEASVVDTPEACVRGSHILASATTSKEPVILGEWLEPGTHINAAGANAPVKHEVDHETFKRASVFVDFKEQVLQEAGDLISAIKSGSISEGDLSAELGDVVIGNHSGRSSKEEITLFKSVGVAIEDIATAAYVYEQASAQGFGTQIDLQD